MLRELRSKICRLVLGKRGIAIFTCILWLQACTTRIDDLQIAEMAPVWKVPIVAPLEDRKLLIRPGRGHQMLTLSTRTNLVALARDQNISIYNRVFLCASGKDGSEVASDPTVYVGTESIDDLLKTDSPIQPHASIYHYSILIPDPTWVRVLPDIGDKSLVVRFDNLTDTLCLQLYSTSMLFPPAFQSNTVRLPVPGPTASN